MAAWKEILNSSKGMHFNYHKFDDMANSAFIKNLRERNDLSQRAFAAILGIPINTVKDWEEGTKPCRGTSSRLLCLLDRHPDLIEELLACEFEEIKEATRE